MLSSSAQDSWRASWKYRSAKSTAVRHHLAEDPVEAAVIEAAGRENLSRAMLQRIDRSRRQVAHLQCPSKAMGRGYSTRCSVRGSLRVAPLRLAVSISAMTQPQAARQALEDAAPVIDDHAVAVGLAAVGMESGLRRRETQQRFSIARARSSGLPVRPARRLGERGRHGEQLRAGGAQAAERAPENARRSTRKARARPTGVSTTTGFEPGATLADSR